MGACGGKAKAVRVYETEAEELLSRVVAEEEAGLLDESVQQLDQAKLEVEDLRKQVEISSAEADQTHALLEDEREKWKGELQRASETKAAAERELERLTEDLLQETETAADEERVLLTEQLQALKALDADQIAVRGETATAIATEVADARAAYQTELAEARRRVDAIQAEIRREEADLQKESADLGLQQEQLLRLESAIDRQAQCLLDSEQRTTDAQKQIEEVRRASIEKEFETERIRHELLERQQSRERVKERATARRRQRLAKLDEIRIRLRQPLGTCGAVGNDIDKYCASGASNVKACISDCIPGGHRRAPSPVPQSNSCGIGLGPHDRLKCKICSLLDLSDTSLLP